MAIAAGRVDLGIVDVDRVAIARMRLVVRVFVVWRDDLLAIDPHSRTPAARQTSQNEMSDHMAHRRHEQKKAYGIGHETRRQQQRARDQQAQAGKNLFDRNLPAFQALLRAGQYRHPLGAQQRSANYGGQYDNGEGVPQPNDLARLNEDRDFEDRNAYERGENYNKRHACSFLNQSLSNLYRTAFKNTGRRIDTSGFFVSVF